MNALVREYYRFGQRIRRAKKKIGQQVIHLPWQSGNGAPIHQ